MVYKGPPALQDLMAYRALKGILVLKAIQVRKALQDPQEQME